MTSIARMHSRRRLVVTAIVECMRRNSLGRLLVAIVKRNSIKRTWGRCYRMR